MFKLSGSVVGTLGLLLMLGACAQSRPGVSSAGKISADLWAPQQICSPYSSNTLLGCFSIQVDPKNNRAYIDVLDLDSTQVTVDLPNGSRVNWSMTYRIYGRKNSNGGFVQLKDVDGNSEFATGKDDYFVINPRSGDHIWDYSEFFVDLNIRSTGMNWVPADLLQGKPVAYSKVSFPEKASLPASALATVR